MPTGVALALPPGYAGFVQPRSGLALRHGVTCLNTPGLIDAGYRDELRVLLVNTDPSTPYEVHRGDRIAEVVIQAVEEAKFVEVTEGELPDSPGVWAASATPADDRAYGARPRSGGSMMERLSGMDAAFLALETDTMHMHVGAVMVFDPRLRLRARPAHALRRRPLRSVIDERIHLVPPCAGAWCGCLSASTTPSGSKTPTSTSTTTCDAPAFPRRGGRLSWPPSSPTSPAAPSTRAARCGRCTSSKGSSRATWPWSPRCTTPCSTGRRASRWWPRSSIPPRSPRRVGAGSAVAARAHPHRDGADRLGRLLARPSAGTGRGRPAPYLRRRARLRRAQPPFPRGGRRRAAPGPSGRRARRSTGPSRPTGASPSPRFPWTRSGPCAASSAAPSTTWSSPR